MKLHDLSPPAGARKRPKRKARGIAGKGGKTAGRGSKGQRARNKIAVGFEGGQMPLARRVPKLGGFKNPFRVSYQAIHLDVIEASELDEITPEVLRQRGLLHKGALAKVLGRGEITRPVTVKAHAFSESAKSAIQAAGGSVELLPKPFKGRPPAKGNALTNR